MSQPSGMLGARVLVRVGVRAYEWPASLSALYVLPAPPNALCRRLWGWLGAVAGSEGAY